MRLLTRAVALVLILTPLACAPSDTGPQSATFEVTFPESLHEGPLDGRLYLMFSSREYDGAQATEPRSLVANWRGGQPMFGIDVEGWMPGEPAVFDAAALGFPLDSLADIYAHDDPSHGRKRVAVSVEPPMLDTPDEEGIHTNRSMRG